MIEVINRSIVRGRVRHALFDFDGTLSLIREGWQRVMIPLMVEQLMLTPGHPSQVELERYAADLVARTTGIQTIAQMTRLAEDVQQRGGQALQPKEYKRIYLDRLWQHIKARVAALKAGRTAPDDLMVPGARRILDELRRRGVRCYLASGTDEPNVVDEAAALGVNEYFAGIYGARDHDRGFSKKVVIDRIIQENGLAGPEFVVFGDGFVEIEDCRSVGGIAVGVASDEVKRSGIDEWKRDRLIQAGADVIVPDFREACQLAAYLFAQD